MQEVEQQNISNYLGRLLAGSVTPIICLLLALSGSAQTQAQINEESIRTVVRISTSVGDFSIGLYNDITWRTITNFLGYVERGDYNQTYIHRTAVTTDGGFQIVQGGAFRFEPFSGPLAIAEDPPTIENEAFFSNVRGTIAMAKVDGDPNSATTQWFINLSDNSESLDDQNGGFTVFGEVLGGETGMTTLDTIIGLQKVSLGARANFAPIITDTYTGVPDEEFVFVNMEVVDRYSSSVNVYEPNRGILIASVNVDDGAEAYSLNFSPQDADIMEVNVDSVLKLIDAPEDAATFDSGSGRLFFPTIEVSAGNGSFVCTNIEFELVSSNPYQFALLSSDDC